MNPSPLELALERAERALIRIRHSADRPVEQRDSQLRAKVVEAIAELDRILADAGGAR